MAAEIAEQPDALARLLDVGRDSVAEVAERVREYAPRMVLFAARGTSDHAALYAKYLVETLLELPAGMVSPSTFTVFGARPSLDGVLWIAVSQSGESPDLVESTRIAGEQGALTLAVTNSPTSQLNSVASLSIDVLAGPERAVAATKSYVNELGALFMLVDLWRGGSCKAMTPMPELARTVIDRAEYTEIVPAFLNVDRLITTGRGYAFPTALEAALKLMETSYVSAHAYSSADLMHGPLALVEADRPVIAIVPFGAGGAAMGPVLDRLLERGASLTTVGHDLGLAGVAHRIWLPNDVAEVVAPMLQVIPLQQLALALAVARGHDPDQPRGLAKVTSTR